MKTNQCQRKKDDTLLGVSSGVTKHCRGQTIRAVCSVEVDNHADINDKKMKQGEQTPQNRMFMEQKVNVRYIMFNRRIC